MKNLMIILVTMLFACTAFSAETAPATPTETSIKELLKVTEIRSLLDGMMGQLNGVMKNATQQALQGKPPTPAQQQGIDKMSEQLVELFKQDMNWKYLESLYVHVYQQTFTQAEVNSMIKFYSSPEGQAVVKKMPMVTQATMSEMQKRMGTLMPKMQQILHDGMQEIQAAGGEKHDEPAPAAERPTTQPVH